MVPDAQHHMHNADAGNHFNETINPKAEERKRFIFIAEPGGNNSFGQVVDNGKNCQCQGNGIEFLIFLVGCFSCQCTNQLGPDR